MEEIHDKSGITGMVESLIGGRSENQDSYGMSDTPYGYLAVVCDGMGGGPAGKTASSLATRAILDYVASARPHLSPVSVLNDAVVAANTAIMNAIAADPSLKGMGTTCVGVLIPGGGNEAYVVHVGDSRCYQLRQGKVVFRTADHSYVGELVRRGTMTEEEGRTSRYSNVITRAIGASPEIVPEVDTVTYRPGDRFALMTDGIWGTMPEPELVGLLGDSKSPSILVPAIATHIDATGTENGGGHDNLTLAMVDTPQSAHVDTLSAPVAQKAAALSTKSMPEAALSVASQPRRAGTLAWVLATLAIACAVGVIVWLIATSGKPRDVETPQPEVPEAKTDIADTVDEIETTDDAPDGDATVEKPTQEMIDLVSKAKETAPEPTQGGGSIDKAIDILKQIRDYNPTDISDYDARLEQRVKMYDSLVETLQNYAKANPAKAESVNAAINQIKAGRSRIINIDKKQRKSTRDSLDEIDATITTLSKIK